MFFVGFSTKKGKYVMSTNVNTKKTSVIKIEDKLKNVPVYRESYTYNVDDSNELNRFRFFYEVDLDLNQINKENTLEELRLRIYSMEEKIGYYTSMLKKEMRYESSRANEIKDLSVKVDNLNRDVQSLRKQYSSHRSWFLRNGWVFTNAKIPKWASDRVMENNLNYFIGEGIQQKAKAFHAQTLKDNLIFDLKFDKAFNNSNIGYYEHLIKKTKERLMKLKSDYNYQSFQMDSDFENDDMDILAIPVIPTKKANDYPNDDWTDEQLVMFYSLSEDRKAVGMANAIIDKRRRADVSRMERKLSETKAVGMEQVMKLASMNSNVRFMDAKLEKSEISAENRKERRRVYNLAHEDDRMTFVIQDRAWYNINGRETNDLNSVCYGYTDVRLVPVKHRFDAIKNWAFDSLIGTNFLHYSKMEEHLDNKFNLFEYNEYVSLMK